MYLVRNILQRLLFLFTTSIWNSNSQKKKQKNKTVSFLPNSQISPRNNFKTHVLGKFFNVSNLVCASSSNRPLFNILQFTLIVRAVGHKQKKNLIVNLLVCLTVKLNFTISKTVYCRALVIASEGPKDHYTVKLNI